MLIGSEGKDGMKEKLGDFFLGHLFDKYKDKILKIVE